MLAYKQLPASTSSPTTSGFPAGEEAFTVEALEELTKIASPSSSGITANGGRQTAKLPSSAAPSRSNSAMRNNYTQGDSAAPSTSTTTTAAAAANRYKDPSSTNIINNSTNNSTNTKLFLHEIDMLKRKLTESDFEIKRLNEQVKTLRLTSSELTERVMLTESEREYYHIKWTQSNPEESQELEDATASASSVQPPPDESVTDSVLEYSPSASPREAATAAGTGTTEPINRISSHPSTTDTESKEKNEFIQALYKYKLENETLKIQIASLQHSSLGRFPGHNYDPSVGPGDGDLDADGMPDGSHMMEDELTSSVARVIAQTQDQLVQEARRLEKVAEECGLAKETTQTLLEQVQSLHPTSSSSTALLTDINNNDIDSDDINPDLQKGQNYDGQVGDTQATQDIEAYQLRQKVLTTQLQELGKSAYMYICILCNIQYSIHIYIHILYI